MKGVIIIADDLVMFGKSKDEHDEYLNALMKRCCTLGVRLNLEKLEMGLDAITFMEHPIRKSGIIVDPEKVRAFWDMTAPEMAGAFHKFLSMTNYVGKFIWNLTTIIKPLEESHEQL